MTQFLSTKPQQCGTDTAGSAATITVFLFGMENHYKDETADTGHITVNMSVQCMHS